MPSRAPAGAHTTAPATMSPSKSGWSALDRSHFTDGSATTATLASRVLAVQVHQRLVQLGQRQRGPSEAGDHAGIDEHEGPVGHGADATGGP